MSYNLFPPEIINHTTESHFVKHSTKSRVIYITVVLVVLSVFVALPFIYIDITAQARGIIRTPEENNQLQTVVYGEVEKISITENKSVKKGDTLIVLRTDKIIEQISSTQNKLVENENFINDIKFLLSNYKDSISTSKYLTEYTYYTSFYSEYKNNTNYLYSEYKRAKKLYEKKVSPKQEYLQYKNNYLAALDKQKSLKEQFKNKWQAEKTNLELQNIELQSTIRQLEEEKTKYIIKAPASGRIIQFSGIQSGNFIGPGQQIAYISTNDNLLVECYISPSDIGFIKNNQDVVFQLDAFNYNQWGLAHGKVKQISNDIVAVNDQAVFKIRCSLEEKHLKLKTGYQGNLKKGMTLTGRFYLTERTLWQLLFDKVDDWLNPKVKA